MNYIIKNGTVVNEGKLEQRDLYIHDGKLVEEGASLKNPQYFDAKGCYVMPGIIDTHVHFRDPGSLRRPILPPRAVLPWQGV